MAPTWKFVRIVLLSPVNYFLLETILIFLGIGDSQIFLLRNSYLLSPVGVYYAYPFMGNYIFPYWGFTMLLLSWVTTSIHQKDKIAYVPLEPVSDYVYISDLNNRLSFSWKTLPNFNFKLKFQT